VVCGQRFSIAMRRDVGGTDTLFNLYVDGGLIDETIWVKKDLRSEVKGFNKVTNGDSCWSDFFFGAQQVSTPSPPRY
jgi:hypothetical protein